MRTVSHPKEMIRYGKITYFPKYFIQKRTKGGMESDASLNYKQLSLSNSMSERISIRESFRGIAINTCIYIKCKHTILSISDFASLVIKIELCQTTFMNVRTSDHEVEMAIKKLSRCHNSLNWRILSLCVVQLPEGFCFADRHKHKNII